jgi:hypothetical protein
MNSALLPAARPVVHWTEGGVLVSVADVADISNLVLRPIVHVVQSFKHLEERMQTNAAH